MVLTIQFEMLLHLSISYILPGHTSSLIMLTTSIIGTTIID